jgi:predicted ATPase
MKPPFVRSIRLDGFLSFAPGVEATELHALNVLIGPNGSGKSNFLEAFSLLSTLSDGNRFQSYFRAVGGVDEWLWKGGGCDAVGIDLNVAREPDRNLHYHLKFGSQVSHNSLALILDEVFEEPQPPPGMPSTYFRTDGNKVEMATKAIGSDGPMPYEQSRVDRQYFRMDQSILSQRATPESYPDNHWLGDQLSRIGEFREWMFGRTSGPRQKQSTDMSTDRILHDASNLAMMVQDISHQGHLDRINAYLHRFLPRFERLSTAVSGGTILLYLHEQGFIKGIPAMRMSDGTLRFIGILLTLLAPNPPPLVCIEEPELGLHPDALSLVAELLVEASDRTQIIVTTHSDALVSALTEHLESVLVCEHVGGTQVRRLGTDALSHWLDKYRLGDLWRMGELGGNP